MLIGKPLLNELPLGQAFVASRFSLPPSKLVLIRYTPAKHKPCA